jgi:AcrR family transcriptional regulator
MSSANLTSDVSAGTPAKNPKMPPRERILAAARELFYSQGIRAVSVDAIAEAADTNKMTLYRHFESKDELVAEYLREVAKDYLAQWNAVANAHAGNPESQLKAWIEHVAAVHNTDDDRGCPFANAAVELPEKDHPARAVIENAKQMYRQKLAELCREAHYRDPDTMADEIVLLFEGACIDRQCASACGPMSRVFNIIRSLIANRAKTN